VRREVEDWFYAMRDEAERNKFFQEQLRNRKFFDGPMTCKTSPALDQALRAYTAAEACGQPALDFKFFGEFLMQPVPAAPPRRLPSPPKRAKRPRPRSCSSRMARRCRRPMSATAMGIALSPLKQNYRVNEESSSRATDPCGVPVLLRCACLGGAIQRVFPNRNVRDPRVEANDLLVLPGKRGFKVTSPAPDAATRLPGSPA